MDNNKFQIEVLQKLAAIDATLKNMDYKAITDRLINAEKKLEGLDFQVKDNKEEISQIKDNNRWLWRTVSASLIAAVLGLIIRIK